MRQSVQDGRFEVGRRAGGSWGVLFVFCGVASTLHGLKCIVSSVWSEAVGLRIENACVALDPLGVPSQSPTPTSIGTKKARTTICCTAFCPAKYGPWAAWSVSFSRHCVRWNGTPKPQLRFSLNSCLVGVTSVCPEWPIRGRLAQGCTVACGRPR